MRVARKLENQTDRQDGWYGFETKTATYDGPYATKREAEEGHRPEKKTQTRPRGQK